MKNSLKCQETIVKKEYTKGNLLDYLYYQNYYKLTGMDLSRKVNTKKKYSSNYCDTTGSLWF